VTLHAGQDLLNLLKRQRDRTLGGDCGCGGRVPAGPHGGELANAAAHGPGMLTEGALSYYGC
jgi:hypothetical protein